jgi:hypothetical protein
MIQTTGQIERALKTVAYVDFESGVLQSNRSGFADLDRFTISNNC